MIFILATICIMRFPDLQQCKDVDFPMMADDVSTHQCMLFGQPSLVKFMEGYPGWRVTKWKCVDQKTHDIIASPKI